MVVGARWAGVAAQWDGRTEQLHQVLDADVVVTCGPHGAYRHAWEVRCRLRTSLARAHRYSRRSRSLRGPSANR